MKKIVMFALFAMLSSAAFSQVTFGNVDCGKWLKSQTAADRAFVWGFISGMNSQYVIENPNASDPLDKLTSADQIAAWLDNWCRENPLKKSTTGLYFLLQELKKK